MNTEITISNTAAIAAMEIIEDYLLMGCSKQQGDFLREVLTALGEADRIVIEIAD